MTASHRRQSWEIHTVTMTSSSATCSCGWDYLLRIPGQRVGVMVKQHADMNGGATVNNLDRLTA